MKFKNLLTIAATLAAATTSAVSITRNGYIAAKEDESTFIFAQTTIAALSECEFSGLLGGAWVNGGKGREAKGCNKEYKPGESLRVQFQCIDGDGTKEYVKCVRVVFRDEPGGVSGVCDYSGFVTRGYKNNDIGFDFRDEANWKAVDSADGEGYGIASVTATFPARPATPEPETPRDLPPGFGSLYDTARSKAAIHGRNIFALFTGSDWCVYCKKLDKEVLSKPAFLDYATNEFECVILDFPHDEKLVPAHERRANEEARKKFEVEGFPMVLVISPLDEKVVLKAGYEPGGAKRWVRNFKKNLRLAPLREKSFRAISEESTALVKANFEILEKIGAPSDTNTAARVKEHMSKWADDTRKIVAKLDALDIPEELEEDRKAIREGLMERIDFLDEFALMGIEEIIELAELAQSAEGGERDADAGGGAPLALPVDGAGTVLDATEKLHLPFGERLFAKPEIEMMGDAAKDFAMDGVVREWLLNRAPENINWEGTFADYAKTATSAWEAGIRTPFVAMAHLASGREKMAHNANMAARRKVWEMWKDDPRWPIASRIAYVATWKTFDSAASNELDRIIVDLKKAFVLSGEWRSDELDRAWFVLTFERGNNKQVFDELKAEGKTFDPWLEAAAMARWHIDKAWEERGDGFANTVSEKGWRGYEEHRAKALDWAEKAYALQPRLTAPLQVGVTANYGNRAEAAKWYMRSAAVYKDNRRTAAQFVWGMRPRWGGTTRQMLDFFEKFLSDDFADTLMPAWALDRISWDVFRDEGGTREMRTYDEWAKTNSATIHHFSELYLTNGIMARPSISLGTRNRIKAIFLATAWCCGDMEMFAKWRKIAGTDYSGMKYADAVKDTDTFHDAGVTAFADWVATQPEEGRAALQEALRSAFATWSPWSGATSSDPGELENFEGFEKLVLPRIGSGELTQKNTNDLLWGYLKFLAGKYFGLKTQQPDGCELGGMLPKSFWVEIKPVPAEMEVVFDLSIDGPDTKGEAMLHFDFGHSSRKFYQRFSVLTVANKTDEKDNRFTILPWPKGETKKSIRLVFRGRDVEVYDNGKLAYTRQLRDGAQQAKSLSFARSGHATVKVERLFIKATPGTHR